MIKNSDLKNFEFKPMIFDQLLESLTMVETDIDQLILIQYVDLIIVDHNSVPSLPSAVGWIAARNSSAAAVESVTNPGILGRLPAQLIRADIAIAKNRLSRNSLPTPFPLPPSISDHRSFTDSLRFSGKTSRLSLSISRNFSCRRTTSTLGSRLK